MLSLSILIFLSYLVGSIPTSIIISKLVKGIDIRQYGSGNAGGTNVMRILGFKAGITVIIIDILKGLFATSVISKFMYSGIPFNNYTPFEDFTLVKIICGTAAVIGHIWTIFGGFRGGKGIATAAGMLIGIAPWDILIVLGVFSIVLFISKYVSLGSISAAIAFPLTLIFRANVLKTEIEGYSTLIYFSIGMALLLIFTHRKNIIRLIQGKEHKITNFNFFKRKNKNE